MGDTSTSAQMTRSQHVRLREYETKRRIAYTSKYDSISLYWKSYKDLLSASIQETGRVQRLIVGTSRAHQLYADAMIAMHNDTFLDDKGSIANKNQQKRLAPNRNLVVQSIEDGNIYKGSKKSSVLKEVREGQKSLGDKFAESANNMNEELADAVVTMHEEIRTNFTAMEQLGTSILKELERTEQEVNQAWGKDKNCESMNQTIRCFSHFS